MMMPAIDLTKVTRLSEMVGEDAEETQELEILAQSAMNYLSAFRWCGAILESYAGLTIAGVVGVFLFRIRATQPDVDEWLWVIVGDLPPAYLVTDDAPNAAMALDVYVKAMQEWVDAVKINASTDDLIPVNAPPTREFAGKLESRLRFLDQRVLEDYLEDLGS